MTTNRHCCRIPCESAADVMVVSNTGHPEDTTDACLAHLGELLGSSMTDREWDSFDYTVVPLALVEA